MYQPKKNNSCFLNPNTRNFEGASLGVGPSGGQWKMNTLVFGDFPTRYKPQVPYILENQVLRSPAHTNPLPATYNNAASFNMVNHRSNPMQMLPPSNKMESSLFRPIINASHNNGIGVAKNQTLAYMMSPAIVLSQNNKNFSAQNKLQVNANHGASSLDKFDSNSVASNPATGDKYNRNENEKIRIFTGTPEKIIQWHKLYDDYFCFYELIASIVSIQEGTVRLQKILLLRDRKGPVIQVVHYVNDHINIENFCVGQMLRCVGNMVGPNILHGLSIREATQDEITIVRRMSYISDDAVLKAVKNL